MARARWNSEGIDDLIAALDSTDDKDLEEIAGSAIYAMANEVANQVKTNLSNLATSVEKRYKDDTARLITPRQKEGLIQSFGISKMRAEGGGWNVKLGFDGYNDVKTKTYPQGQPNTMIARLTESGSTWRQKQPFFRPALNSAKAKAMKAGEAKALEKLKEKF